MSQAFIFPLSAGRERYVTYDSPLVQRGRHDDQKTAGVHAVYALEKHIIL